MRSTRLFTVASFLLLNCGPARATGGSGGADATADAALPIDASSSDAALADGGVLDDASADGGSVDAGSGDGGSADGAVAEDTGVSTDSGADSSTGIVDAPTRTLSYAPTNDLFANPDRGFYRPIELTAAGNLDFVQNENQGDSLVFSYVRLDNFRNGAIDNATLNAMVNGFARVRAARLGLVLRFAYNFGPSEGSLDAPIDRVESHLAQIAPRLVDSEDVLTVMQAGFIGAWGEWHASSNGLHSDPEMRRRVATAVLRATPPTRSVQIRYPPYIWELIGGTSLTDATAWTGSDASRIGYHNDCFLSSATDVGTYPQNEIEEWKTRLDQYTRYVPVGGETCIRYPALSDCAPAIREMARHHYSYINRDYQQEIINSWRSQGCLPEIERRLGYRLALASAEIPEAARPGGTFVLAVVLNNTGFAAPFNARPVELVVESGGMRFTVALPIDVRHLQPGEHRLSFHIGLPSALPTGTASVRLAFPPAFGERHPDRMIRLANTMIWQETSGEHTLGTVQVSESAPGSTSARAGLQVIPASLDM